MEIGTSMLARQRRRASHADEKNGRPANAMAGTLMSAESQWNRPRVASSAPDQM